MTVSSTTRKAGPYTGNSITTLFPLDFKVYEKADLRIVLTDVSGNEQDLVLDSDYTVTLNADQDGDPGGSVTYPISGNPMSASNKLTIVSAVPNTQLTDLNNSGAFYPETVEDMVDRATIQIQQLDEEVDRSLKLAVSDVDGAGAYRAGGNRISGVGDAEELDDAVNLGTLEAALAAVPGGTGFFQQLGTGAVSRTFQSKMRDVFAVPDFSTTADAIAALVTAGGGTLYVPNGVAADVVPSNGVLMDFAGRTRNNVFQETGETTWHSMRTLRGGNGGVHTGQAESLMTLEWRPTGSGTNGPTHADYGLTVSAMKHNWATTTTVGEMDVLNLCLRQGGPTSDGVLIIGNAQTAGTGFVGALETATSVLDTGTNTLTQSVSLQAGILDNINNNHFGYFTRANIGALSAAFLADTNSGSTWNYLFRGQAVGVDKFAVTGSGVVQLFDASSSKKSLQARSNGFEILSNGGTSLFFLADNGLATFPSQYVNAQALLLSGTIPAAAGANQIFLGGAIATSATAGGGQATPATVAGYMVINVAGTQRKIPYYAS